MKANASGNELSADSRMIQEVLKTEQALDEALVKGDIAALETLLAKEVTRTSPMGIMTNRSEWWDR